ncbi:hypothetical protein FEZ18_03160 [Oceanihabitans sp. IOP_32]|uniref:hypothetical protein n=1 Tax=Oceanihabitans sp. IOP_32 TaxID=2529032 RepID=UPI00129413AC|nr:hypothetical protein [Oceanihabitans sp. IOP_32]QFZ53876.1 hypothetical protein FEZ18_03160 [Oceanihabitans sp. IOP_32]
MKTKLISLFLACFIISTAFSQSVLNDYKYVIVPKKFGFLNEENQYRLNELAKFLFEKEGFIALMESEIYPDELIFNRCLALKANVLKESGLFKTKLKIQLKDCNDRVVYTSPLGESRIKEFDKAYVDAMRKTFQALSAQNYKYNPAKSEALVTAGNANTIGNETTQEIQKPKEKMVPLKKENEAAVEVLESEIKAVTPTVTRTSMTILYAQAIENGFQLVDSTPKVVYRIKSTNLNDVFLVENKSALIYKKDNDWVLEYYVKNDLKQDILNIKF